MQTRKKSALKGGIRSEQIGKASVKQNSSKTDKVWGRNPVTSEESKSGRARGEKTTAGERRETAVQKVLQERRKGAKETGRKAEEKRNNRNGENRETGTGGADVRVAKNRRENG